jgi:hypothetical protein
MRYSIFLYFLLLLGNISCQNDENKYEQFFTEELQLTSSERANSYYYFININSCSGCLEINNYFLLENELNQLKLIFVGDMESRGFFNRNDYNKSIWEIREVKEPLVFKYDIYTNDPLLVKFGNNGRLEFTKNIKVEEIQQLIELIE